MIKNFILLTMLALGLTGFADQVVFKNGRTLDCTIIAVHPKHVEVSLGSGSMNIPKNQLSKLIRTKGSNAASQQPASEKNLLSAQNAPEAHSKLAAEFRALMKQRNAAKDAKYMMNLHEKEIRQLTTRIEQLVTELKKRQAELDTVSKEMAAIKLPEQTARSHREYKKQSALVKKKVALNDQMVEMQTAMTPLRNELSEAGPKREDLRKKVSAAMTPLPSYFNAVAEFGTSYSEYKADLDFSTMDEISKQFFAKIDRYMIKFKSETSLYVIDSWNEGNTTFVRATVNGKATGVFILDTGATVMTLSESFAKRLGIQMDELPFQEAQVADGRTVEIRPVTLSSVQVGDAIVKNVVAGVLGDGTNAREDGLLGMSFLRHFSIGINGSSGEIALTRFEGD